MRLEFEKIKSYTKGAVSVTQREDGIIEFDKCTKKQSDAWRAYSGEVLEQRAKTTTGVRIDFITNSKKMKFKTASGAKFEVLINSTLEFSFVIEDASQPMEQALDLLLPSGEVAEELRVTLVFPSHSRGTLEYIELDDGSYTKACEYSRKILFLGDSITQGWNSKHDSLSYAWRVTNYYNADTIINGVGGGFFEPETFEKVDFDPEVIIIAYGTNDYYKYSCFDVAYEKTCKYFDLIAEAYPDKKIIALSPIWRANGEGKAMGEEFCKRRKMIEDEAAKRGFFVVPGIFLVPADKDFYDDRFLHPNELGFSLYAENLIKSIDKYIG